MSCPPKSILNGSARVSLGSFCSTLANMSSKFGSGISLIVSVRMSICSLCGADTSLLTSSACSAYSACSGEGLRSSTPVTKSTEFCAFLTKETPDPRQSWQIRELSVHPTELSPLWIACARFWHIQSLPTRLLPHDEQLSVSPPITSTLTVYISCPLAQWKQS